jgi:signal transduction histidine kinase
VVLTRPDGSRVSLLATTAPLRLESGAITGSVSVFQDITERKSLEQQKNDFLSMASHELRTPITSIQGFAEILQLLQVRGQSLDSPLSTRAINQIVEQSQCLTRLIEEMLDLTRLEQARLLFHFAPHDLLKTLAQVIESQALLSKQHALRLVLEEVQSGEAVIGCFDEERIVQVLSNLISNAIKYSPRGGEIEIGLRRTREQPGEALVWVKDRGIGIPAGALPHIFERFYRSEKLEHAISGLGIGLYLVKEIVTRHGGRVWVESTEGAGSTFSVQLPLAHPDG